MDFKEDIAKLPKPSIEVYGVHTLLPALKKTKSVWENTLLRLSEGRLPPYIVVVGDRRRVVSSAKLLERAVLLHDEMAKAGANIGRVNVAVGLYKGTPIALVEHGMGCACAEIIIKEAIAPAHCVTEFRLPLDGKDGGKDGACKVFKSDAKYLIRVGSCAGINKPEKDDGAFIEPFDLVVTDSQVGVSGTDIQSLTGVLEYRKPGTHRLAHTALEQLGYEFSPAGWPLYKCDKQLSGAVARHARKLLNVGVHFVNNCSKDSLYAEASEESFVELRKSHDIGSSEMEFSVIARLAAQHTAAGHPTKVAMALTVLGTIPGAGFEDDKEKEEKTQRVSLLAAFEALHEISQQHTTEQ